MSPVSPSSGIVLLFTFLWLTGLLRGVPVISEIHYHPAAIDGSEPTTLEFIELTETGDAASDLDGWQIDRGVTFLFPDVQLAAGERLVVAADPDAFKAAYPNIDNVLGPWLGTLSNRGESIRLLDHEGEIVDRVRYADEGDWAVRRRATVGGQPGWIWEAPHDGGGYSLELIDLGRTNASGQNWKTSLIPGGTPGHENSVSSQDTPPMITNAGHHPAVPTARDEVLVSATILTKTGEDVDVKAHYRLSTNDPGPFQEMTMHSDESGRFAAALPPQPHGRVVEFYLSATSNGLTQTWPSPTDSSGTQGANALYQVDEEAEDSDQPYYRVIMPVEEDLRFRPSTFPSGSNAQMNATFIVSRHGETSVRYRAGIRRRGNSSRSRDPRSFRLSLPSDRPWRGVTRLNLLGQYTYLQVLGLHLCQAAGLPAPDAKLIQLRLNGINYANPDNNFGRHYGSYAHIQPLNATFVEKKFPDDSNGNLYRKISANPSRDRKRWGVHFEDQIRYTEPNWYITDRWTKETNRSANDWTVFQEFIVAINEAEAETYLDQISSHVHLDQWLRWFALLNFINNRETNLSNGIDDDYSMYHGVNDSRMVLLPHDLDTIFGLGDSRTTPTATIFQAIDTRFGSGASIMPQLVPFFNHPEIRPLYFQQLEEFAQTLLHPDRFGSTIDQLLPHVPDTVRENIKTFNQQRRSHVLGIINAGLEVEVVDGHLVSGTYEVSSPGITLQGSVSPMHVTEVRINGEAADYDRGRGQWQISSFSLQPGYQTLVVEAMDVEGRMRDSQMLRINRIGADAIVVSGTLTDNLILSAGLPYRVEGRLVVPPDIVLTVQPGTGIQFAEGSMLEVAGTLSIQGAPDAVVTLTAAPGETWNGVSIIGNTDSRIEHVRIERMANDHPAIHLIDAYAELHEMDLTTIGGPAIRLEGSSANVNHCRFPRLPDGRPFESFGGLLEDHPIHLSGNQFGWQVSDVPVIEIRDYEDLRSARVAIVGNTFAGGFGTAIDLSGRSYIGNNVIESSATAMCLRNEQGYMVSGNVVSNTDTALHVPGKASIVFEQNTLHQVETFLFRGEEAPRVHLAHSILDQVGTFSSDPASLSDDVSINQCLLPRGLEPLLGELAQTSIFTNDTGLGDDLRLTYGSPALGSGFYGQDLGADNKLPLISGLPLAITPNKTIELQVSGSGWHSVRYRIDGKAWKESNMPFIPDPNTSRSVRLRFTGLRNEAHEIEIVGVDFAGNDVGDTPHSLIWEIDAEAPAIIINEIAASNTSHTIDDLLPDWVEIRNLSNRRVNVRDYQLADDADLSNALILPAGTSVPANGLLTIPLSRIEEDGSGFALDADGEQLLLLDADGKVLDQITFGRQLNTHTLGRDPRDPNRWTLGEPTPNQPNQRAFHTGASQVRLNEWYAAAGLAFSEDFVELYHNQPWPADLSGVSLTEGNVPGSSRFTFPPHTYIGNHGFALLRPNELGFALDRDFESLTLHDPNGDFVDRVFWQAQSPRQSLSRQPDGGRIWQSTSIGTPEAANLFDEIVSEEVVFTDWTDSWQYYQNEMAPLSEWHLSLDAAEGWQEGSGAFFRENADLAVLKQTPLLLNPPTTHYFRTVFQVTNSAAIATLTLHTLLDDGGAVYLNGEEIRRLRMPEGEILHSTFADDGASDASVEGPFEIDPGLLREGGNIFAASVHQDDGSSSDVVFAARLTGQMAAESDAQLERSLTLLRDLRITEIMFHPANPDEEWLELRNLGNQLLELGGVRFSEGIHFVFPEWQLEPGERVIVAGNRPAFEARYPDASPVIGEFTGRLDNRGETIALQLPAPHEANILRFRYERDWEARADGGGHSLTIRNDMREAFSWDTRDAWASSKHMGGSPGAPEAPIIYSATPLSTILNEPYQYLIQATNEPNAFGIRGFPPGLTVDPDTGLIEGAPEEFGNFEVTITAANDTGTSERRYRFQVDASGPPAKLKWETFPETATQDQPFEVALSIRDAADRLVRTFADEARLTASVIKPTAGPVVAIVEVRDGNEDGLTLVKSDPVVNTGGWRVLLNAAADRGINAIHGVNGVPGEVIRLPVVFDTRVLDEDDMGFNLLWSDDPPSEREGGQKGWAMVVDANNVAVDFVVWGYSDEELSLFQPVDDGGQTINGHWWDGSSVPHSGGNGATLQRIRFEDSDSHLEWGWRHELNLPDTALDRRALLDLSPQVTNPFAGGRWSGDLTTSSFGSQVYLEASLSKGRLTATTTAIDIAPAATPQLPAALVYRGLVGLPLRLSLPSDRFTESLRVENLVPGLSFLQPDYHLVGMPEAAGSFEMSAIASNRLGDSVSKITLRVLADSDRDGISDAWELEHNLDPDFPNDALEDPDRDQRSNQSEFYAGTDPFSFKSALRILEVKRRSPDMLEIAWSSIPGRTYQVWSGAWRNGFIQWTPLLEDPYAAVSEESVITIPFEPLQANYGRLLRVSTAWLVDVE